MQPTKKIETDVLKVYDAWLQSYLNGDVETYDSFLDDDYHFIGSATKEEFLNRKDTTQFFADTGDQFASKTQIRNDSKIIEQFGELIFITHVLDGWFLHEKEWNFYSRFRFSSVLRKNKDGWRFIYQHFSIPDPKTAEGETIGYDKINEENQELREAIQRRTIELEQKNRELKVESALDRIRAEATAMTKSSDLLDVVVNMRKEFISLGHEAHYFWHMMWLPDTYEKAMTSGDGTKIGFVMNLPRYIHGDIPLLAKWEKSKKPTVVYAMDVEEAIDYVDKMIDLGDFQNIDPQAPSHDDIHHIGGLTFIMARTTHGEIGYSLPGIVKNPPQEDLQILERFAGAFDLAHRRFLDLQKAEQQAREVEIELALERVRSRTMAMQHSDELQEASFLLDEQVRGLGIKTWGCAFHIYGKEESTEWFGNEAGVLPTYTVPRTGIFKKYYNKGQKGASLWIEEFSGKACIAHYESMSKLPVIGDVLLQLKDTNNGFPTYQIDHVVYFKYGYLLFITREAVPESYGIFKRFAKVFEQTYTRFLDLQKAEAQAREAQIELGLERVRARAMAMQSTKELSDLVSNLLNELTKLDFSLTFCIINIVNEPENSNTVWAANPEEGKAPESYNMKFEDYPFHHAMMREWKAQTPKFIYVMEGEEKEIYDDYLYTDTEFSRFPKDVQTANRALDKYVSSFVFSKFGGLQTVGDQPLSDENLDILFRFGKVFDLTYTRFNDLQKAEEQAHEAKLEAAMERVRSRSLAMTKSEQLSDVILEIHNKFKELDISMESRIAIVVVFNSDGKDFNQYIASNDVGNIYISTPYFEHPILDDFYSAKEAGVKFFSKSYTEDEKNSYFKTFFETSIHDEIEGVEEQAKWVFEQKYYTHSQAFQKNSSIGMADYSGIPLNDNEIDVIKRFSKVFDQAYTRFLDLKKAEIQTREAQINLAVERVRAKALAMHKSEEIMEVVAKLKDEVMGLDIPGVVAATIFLEADNNYIRMWDLSALERSDKGYLAITDITFKLKKIDPNLYIKRVWETNENYFVDVQNSKDLDRIIEFMYENNQLEVAQEVEEYTKSTNLQELFHASKRLNNGKLCIDLLEPPPAEMEAILDKIGAAFDLAYQRFLDLQKAEAQTKESQIEAALEKVRSRSLAMQKPDELQEVVAIVAEKLKELGVIFDAGGVILCTYFPDNKDVVHWIAVPDFSSSGRYYVPYFDNPIFNDAWESKIRGDAYFSKEFPVEVKNHFFEHTFKHSDYRDMPEDYKQFVLQAESHALSAAWSKNSAILIPSLTGVVPSENDAQIMQRFAKVFEQAYIRFMDLQQAEIREKEAIKQASLDRVRGEIASMRTTKDLERITPLIWKELTTLGVPFFRCGVFIIREDEKMVHAYLSKPDGTSVAALHIPFSDSDNKLIKPTIENWRLQQPYKETWNQDQFIQQTHLFLKKGQIENPEAYDISETPPEQLVLHLIPFKQGMVYVGNHEDLTEDQISLVESLSTAFSVAYSRYEDFKALETAKNSLELTINDLKSAQAQLIQAEKMASLGELTAGIAHEIQNPLNFVNNFSEVSEELVDEMNEELDNGDLEEAKAISKDLKDNLGKINHHGKRADAIVKGMLEHSRINKGEKKPTDINALLDEFVRLSYHGLRAKDKSFNADFKLKLDPNLPKVNVMSSDIGRVILNLVNNAFYACAERSRSVANKTVTSEINSYKPEVIVSSKQTEHGIELSVKDNGGGIPEQVKDKIFQPFFTTKPTGKGTGLGLSLSYDIIKAHGGKLTLESSERNGTLFSIQIPIQ